MRAHLKGTAKEMARCASKGSKGVQGRGQGTDSRWIGPYVILKAYPSGYVDLMTERGEFKVNGHRLKLYNENDPIRNGEVYHLSEEPITYVSQRKSQPDQNSTKAKQKPLRVREFSDRHFSSFAIVEVENSENSASVATSRREVRNEGIPPVPFGFSLQFSSHSATPWRQRCTHLSLVSNDWEKALKTHEPIYYELVLEFLATFSFDVEAYDEDRFDGPCVRFRLLGEWYGVTLPLSRLVDQNAITNLSFVMAKMFQSVGKVHDKTRTGLYGGHFITVIVEKLGTLTPKVCETLTKLSPMGFLDKVLFRSMKLLAPGPRRGTFVWIGDATPNEGPIGMATSPPQPTFPGQSSNPPPANQQGSGSIHEAIKGLSEQMGVEHHDIMERLDRILYDMYGVRRELSWVTTSMSEYFESVGHAPSAPLAPHPVWHDSDDVPVGNRRHKRYAADKKNDSQKPDPT
ncbi:hypothetical protein OSB04_031814 [Centaurea solstitialis]|uniref:Uncharacterized protein n=1 Tax=Centaurea solstitialis TaxID=347529 RepID=A0AA38SME1_9ASTR|nr:hypothetical protein OSB04_031814 [Centaurea solstitialis]